MHKWSQEESCSVEAKDALHSIRDNGKRSAARTLRFDNVLLCRSTRMICPSELLNQVFHPAFRRGEMVIACDTAFRSSMQSCDLAVIGARAKQHGFDGRQLKELTLTHETWFQHIV